MYPERIRTRSNLRPPEITAYAYGSLYPGYVKQPGKWIGEAQTVLDNYSKAFHDWRHRLSLPKIKRPKNTPYSFFPSVTTQLGGLRLNPAEFRKFNGTCTPGRIQQNVYPYFTIVGDIAAYAAYPDTNSTPVVRNPKHEDLALSQAYAGMIEPDVDLGMMLAESKQTLALLREVVQALSSPLGTVLKPLAPLVLNGPKGWANIKKEEKRIRAILNKVANSWLQLRYGILPLVSDANGLIKLYKSTLDSKGLKRSSGGSVISQNKTITEVKESGDFFDLYWRTEYSTIKKVSSQAYYQFSADCRYSLGLGLDVLDIPNLLWELVPFSFVVDWAFNFGTWLRTIQPRPGIVYLGNCVSIKEQVAVQRINTSAHIAWTPSKPVTPTTSVYNSINQKMLRVIDSPVPVFPVLRWDFLNLTRTVDSISLLWQKMPKGFH